MRTPYGADASGNSLTGAYKELAEEGYIFVFQDIRGRYGSEGTFVMQRPPRPIDAGGGKAIDESTDAYDSIDWMIKGGIPRNNGRVGMMGVSYPGWTAAMGMLDPHPALKAVSPQASPSDMWIGDDFHHNGAFRLSYGFEYAYMVENAKGGSQFEFENYDTYEWYGVFAPGKMPKDVLNKLSREIARIVKLPDVSEKLIAQGAIPVGNTPEEFRRFLKVEAARYAEAVRAAIARLQGGSAVVQLDDGSRIAVAVTIDPQQRRARIA